MEGLILSYKRSKHRQKTNHLIIRISGVNSKESARKLLNKKVVWESPAKKQIKGVIADIHGNLGKVRAIFEKGLPGQAVGNKIKIE